MHIIIYYYRLVAKANGKSTTRKDRVNKKRLKNFETLKSAKPSKTLTDKLIKVEEDFDGLASVYPNLTSD